jgi:ABC-type polysaccharide/polyol phosphate export permease
MVSGALFPDDKAHGWMRLLMKINPMTYGLAALRRLLDPAVPASTPSLELSLVVTAICGLILLAASAWAADRGDARDTTV